MIRSALTRSHKQSIGRYSQGSDLAADLVVDATGRRSPVEDWLTQAGARDPRQVAAECGIAYVTRHYRVRTGVGCPPQ